MRATAIAAAPASRRDCRLVALAFFSAFSYQSPSLNRGADRGQMGCAGLFHRVAIGRDHLRSRSAAPLPARECRNPRPTLWRAPRLQFRREEGTTRGAALLAHCPRARPVSELRLLLREQRIPVGAEFRRQISASYQLSRLVSGWRPELHTRELRRGERQQHQPQSADWPRRASWSHAALRRGETDPWRRQRVSVGRRNKLALS